ncbi:MAG: glycosyltransferase, partial [Candidatus Aminicenantales bacterium]
LNIEKKIEDQKIHIENYKKEIKDKKQLIQTLKKEINQQKKEIYDKEVHIRNLENNLNLILKSKVWRTADFFRRVFYMRILKIFPPLQKSALTITREGFGSFWQKVKKKQLLKAKDEYDIWLEQNALTPEKIKKIREDIKSFAYKPKISLIMPVYNVERAWLEKAVASVFNQLYDNWELCIVDDASTKKHIKEVLLKYQTEPKVKVKFLGKNMGIAEASNQALALASGQYVGFLDDDDELSPDALYENVKLLNRHPEADLIYSDEDKLNPEGKRIEPFFKPDWSPDLLLSYNYICHFVLYHRKLIDDLGGLRPGFEGSQDYDLLLRFTEKTDKIFHIPKVLYHWRQVKGSTASLHQEKIAHITNSTRALEEALKRRGIEGEVVKGINFDQFESYRVKRKIKGSPLVSIIIPMKDMVSFLQRNLGSIEAKTEYKNYEILIVNNNSREKETYDYFESLKDRHNIRIIDYNQEFNFSKINNFAVSQAKGEHILFLNNDIEVISKGWLKAMLEHSVRKEVGAVGAKLIFPNDTIQHAGTVLGLGGVAGHSHKHFPAQSNGYFGALNTIRNYSAVTAACLMTKKKIFEEVGGFDEVHLSVAFNDVDLCLKIRDKGYFIVYTPFAVLRHYESSSRGYDLNPDEILYMKNKWGKILFHDPYYNPNLTFDSEDFSLDLH